MPEPFDGIQVNTCRTPTCENFGVYPLPRVRRGSPRPNDPSGSRDDYRLAGGASARVLRCNKCGRHSILKSNRAVAEELARIERRLQPTPEPGCPKEGCPNHGFGLHNHRRRYVAFGRTPTGSQRWRCRACKTTFLVARPTVRQSKSHENLTVFRLLVNKSPIRGIARVCGLSPPGVYSKIAFIHRQCLAFASARERELTRGIMPRLYLSTDRQDYVINWPSMMDRQTIKLTAVATAANQSGYVFAINLNYDPTVVRPFVETMAILVGDHDPAIPSPAYRHFARLRLKADVVDPRSEDRSLQRRRIQR